MATPSKTQATSLVALQSLASGSVLVSNVVDVSTKFAGMAYVHFGRRATTALTAGCSFRIEASAKSSGDGFWFPLYTWSSQVAAALSMTVTGTNNAGQNVLQATTTPAYVAGDLIYIDNTTIANSEFQRIKVVTTNTSVTLEDNLTNAQNNPAATTFNKAEWWGVPLDLSGVGRVRLVVDAASGPTGQNVAVEAFLTTLDSVT